MIPDETQVPPVGTALPPAGDQPAQQGAPPPAEQVTSVVKVENAIQGILADKPAPIQAFLKPLIGSLNLPQEASTLDKLLLEGAGFLLTLRSDGAEAASVITGQPPALATVGIPAIVQDAINNVAAATAALVAAVAPESIA